MRLVFNFLFFIMCMHVHAHTTACVEIKTQCDGVFKGLILFFHHSESRDLNPGHQACQEAPFPTEPSHQPSQDTLRPWKQALSKDAAGTLLRVPRAQSHRNLTSPSRKTIKDLTLTSFSMLCLLNVQGSFISLLLFL